MAPEPVTAFTLPLPGRARRATPAASASGPEPTPSRPRSLPRRAVLPLALLALLPGPLLRAAAATPASPTALPTTEAEWRAARTAGQFRVLRRAGTERPFSSALNGEARPGTFRCAGCAQPVFDAGAKFDSGTGWPSFFRPVPGGVVLRQTAKDRLLMQREVACARCGGHLGHVFADGPRPTGLRYCINGVAMGFVPE